MGGALPGAVAVLGHSVNRRKLSRKRARNGASEELCAWAELPAGKAMAIGNRNVATPSQQRLAIDLRRAFIGDGKPRWEGGPRLARQTRPDWFTLAPSAVRPVSSAARRWSSAGPTARGWGEEALW